MPAEPPFIAVLLDLAVASGTSTVAISCRDAVRAYREQAAEIAARDLVIRSAREGERVQAARLAVIREAAAKLPSQEKLAMWLDGIDAGTTRISTAALLALQQAVEGVEHPLAGVVGRNAGEPHFAEYVAEIERARAVEGTE